MKSAGSCRSLTWYSDCKTPVPEEAPEGPRRGFLLGGPWSWPCWMPPPALAPVAPAVPLVCAELCWEGACCAVVCCCVCTAVCWCCCVWFCGRGQGVGRLQTPINTHKHLGSTHHTHRVPDILEVTYSLRMDGLRNHGPLGLDMLKPPVGRKTV